LHGYRNYASLPWPTSEPTGGFKRLSGDDVPPWETYKRAEQSDLKTPPAQTGYGKDPAEPKSKQQDERRVPTYELLKRLLRIEEREIVWSHLEWAFGPPLAILVVGAALGWAFAGFRGTRRGNMS
jgi:hypothetical protein